MNMTTIPESDGNYLTRLHDPFYRQLFSIYSVVEGLIRYFLASLIPGTVDYSSLVHYSESSITRDMSERREDMIWRVRTYQGNWVYIFLLTEFQSTSDRWMAVRMIEYVAVFLRKISQTKEVRDSKHLPLVLPIVIYNGYVPWTAPVSLAHLLPTVPAPLCHFQPQQTYYLLDIGRLAQDVLDKDASFVARFFELERARTPDAIRQAVQKVSAYLAEKPDMEISQIVSQWVRFVGLPRVGVAESHIPATYSLVEIEAMINTEFELWKEGYRQEGLQQGLQQVARNLAAMPMNADQIAHVTGLSQAEVQSILAETSGNTDCPAN